LEAQLAIAVELRRNVSIHSVKAQQATVDLLLRMQKRHREGWESICIDLHSCGLSAETWTQIEKSHPNTYISLSTVINVRPNSSTHLSLIKACSPTRMLVESDFNTIDQCTQRTWDMVCVIAEARGWHVESVWNYPDANDGGRSQKEGHNKDWGVVKRLEMNWEAFQSGGLGEMPLDKESRKARRLNERQRRYVAGDESESDDEIQ